MRNIITISVPEDTARFIRSEVRGGHFGSTSEFFRHLVRLYNTEKLAQSLTKQKKSFDSGKGKELRSLRDLVSR